jgi:phenylacetate-CoA ligase
VVRRRVHRRLAWLKETEWWSAREIADYQDARLREMVAHAYATTPWYREALDAHGVRPADIRSRDDLPKLPILTKAQLCAQPRGFVSRAYRPRQLWHGETGGTTGTPLPILLTRDALQFQWAVWWRHKARFGLGLLAESLMFGTRPVAAAGQRLWRRIGPFRQTYLSSHLFTDDSMPEVARLMNREQFAFYTGRPSLMYRMASFMRERGITLARPPRYLVSGSETLLPTFERALAATFRAPVTDQYGSAEACVNFARCERGRYHLDAEFCIAELLPLAGGDDPRLRRIVCTGLANPAMPLIRYDVGDYGVVSEGPCPCGRQTPSLDSIEGRTEDYIRTPDGRKVVAFNQVFEAGEGILEAQLVQEARDLVAVLLVTDGRYGRATEAGLEGRLRRRLGDGMRIEFRQVERIARTRNGKFRAVVSHLGPDTPEEAVLQRATQQDAP